MTCWMDQTMTTSTIRRATAVFRSAALTRLDRPDDDDRRGPMRGGSLRFGTLTLLDRPDDDNRRGPMRGESLRSGAMTLLDLP